VREQGGGERGNRDVTAYLIPDVSDDALRDEEESEVQPMTLSVDQDQG
jgi:hypothetical protein